MAKKSGNFLIKLVVLLAVAGAVFFALNSWRNKAGVADVATTDASAPTEAGATTTALSREEAQRIGTEIGTRIGTEIGTQIGREVAAQMLAERKIQPTAAAPEPALPAPPPAEPAPTPAPEPEPQPAPASAPAETVASAEPAPAPAPRKPRIRNVSAAKDPWWIKSQTNAADGLVLTYAGNFKSADSKPGVALMFSGQFDAQTDFTPISVAGSGGNTVAGQWKVGSNPKLIYLTGIPKGSYTVSIKSGFKSSDGKTLRLDLSGPVKVR